jgi:capsular exopolysaccharide synthesis family protein
MVVLVAPAVKKVRVRAHLVLIGMAEHDAVARPDLQAAGGLLRRRFWVMLPFFLIPIAALAFSLSQEERYTASASILFSDQDILASDLPEREAATNVQLLTLDEIKRGVVQRLAGPIAQEVEASQAGDANVLTIKATDPSPERAARTANAYAAAYIDFRRAAARRDLLAAQRFVQNEIERLADSGSGSGRALARRRALERRQRRLEFEESRERGGAREVQAATVPSSPSSPKPVRNTVIGGIVALFLALLTALLFERLDPRMLTPKEVEATLDRPILGLIRKSRALARSPVGGKRAPADVDDFLALRAHLRYLETDHSIRSVLVTSSAEGDGKTTIAWNLAWVAAERDSRVLFVEGDLRRPTLAKALGLHSEQNLTRVLDGSATLPDVTQEVALPSTENGRLPPRVMTVALAGTVSTRSTDALAWERLGAGLREAERHFDLIVIDTAPILLVPDAIPLLSQVGGVVVVGRLRRTRRVALARLKEQLDTVAAPTLGAVVNSVGKDTAYGYGYYGRRYK